MRGSPWVMVDSDLYLDIRQLHPEWREKYESLGHVRYRDWGRGERALAVNIDYAAEIVDALAAIQRLA